RLAEAELQEPAATVHGEGCTVHIPRFVAGEVEHCGRHFIGVCPAVGGDRVQGPLANVGGSLGQPGYVDHAWQDAVAGNASSAILQGDRVGQAAQAGLGRRVVRLSIAAVDGADAADVDDASETGCDHVR